MIAADDGKGRKELPYNVKGESEGRTHIDDVRQHQRRSDYYTFSAVQTKGMHDVPTKLNNARSLNKVCVAVTALPEL